MKIPVAFLISFFIVICNNFSVFAVTDEKIFTDKVENIYAGESDTQATVQNLKFTDTNNHWAKEAITKAGALNMVKGYEDTYRPDDYVSSDEVVAFLVRVIGFEKEALAEGEKLKSSSDGSLKNMWSIGYLSIAKQKGIITAEEYDIYITDKGKEYMAREKVASLIINALNIIRTEPLKARNTQNIYNYKDWEKASIEHIENLEIALANGILKGADTGMLNPKGALTRGEMAQVLSNLDELYNDAVGLTKKTGTISGIKDIQTTETGKANLERNLYIRTADGKVDIIKYEVEKEYSPEAASKDVVVYNLGSVTGLGSIVEGSEIEYLVDDTNKIAKFIAVKSKKIDEIETNGILKNIYFEKGIIEIQNETGKKYKFYAQDGLIGEDNSGKYVHIGDKKIYNQKIPMGSNINIELKNNIVAQIDYVGGATLIEEIQGIVLENNPHLQQLTIIDIDGKNVTKKYDAYNIKVEKQPHYDSNDNIGYIDEVFPNFEYDKRDTTIDKIEVGDIVFIRPSEDNPSYIESISGTTNYHIEYGEIEKIETYGDIYKATIDTQNKGKVVYDIPKNVFVSKGGKAIVARDLKVGDTIKLLVNETALQNGSPLKAVKEIILEDNGYLIGDILKGKFASLDPIQNSITLEKSYILNRDNWDNYKQIRNLNLGNNTKYYYNDKEVSADYLANYAKGENTYLAVQKTYSGDTICKITSSSSDETFLGSQNITYVGHAGGIRTHEKGFINTNEGTIIKKDGKLTSINGIKKDDLAYISVGENGIANVIDVYGNYEYTENKILEIARGAISEIEEGKEFTIKSPIILEENKWRDDYSKFKFLIDEETLIITEEGIKTISSFIDYTQESSIDKVFTVVYDGYKATHIFQNAEAKSVLRGEVYSTDEGIKIKETQYLSGNSWKDTDSKNATANLAIKQNTIIIKNNKVVSLKAIEKNDKIRVFTSVLPDPVTANMNIETTIILVDN